MKTDKPGSVPVSRQVSKYDVLRGACSVLFVIASFSYPAVPQAVRTPTLYFAAIFLVSWFVFAYLGLKSSIRRQ